MSDFDNDDWLESGSDDWLQPLVANMPKGEVVNKSRVATIFGISQKTVERYLRDGLPYISKGQGREGWRFDTVAVFKWLVQRSVSLATGNDDAVALESARLRNTDVRARLAELEYARQARVTITRAEAAAIYSEHVTEFRKRLLELPDQVQDLSETQRKQLEDAINQALAEFSGMPRTGEEDSRVAD